MTFAARSEQAVEDGLNLVSSPTLSEEHRDRLRDALFRANMTHEVDGYFFVEVDDIMETVAPLFDEFIDKLREEHRRKCLLLDEAFRRLTPDQQTEVLASRPVED